MSETLNMGEQDSFNQPDKKLIKRLLDQLKVDDDDPDDPDRLVGEFFNHYLKRVERKEFEFMFVVSVLLPDLISKTYKGPIAILRKRLTYVKFPSEFSSKQKFASTREHLWGYKYPYYKFSDPNYKFPLNWSPFDRFSYIPSFFTSSS